ncbi:MAG: ATP-binding protein, partial [Prevotella sp.]
MNEKDILRVLVDQQEEIANYNANNWCERMEEQLFDMESSLAQVVIGVRRSGKSTLCHKVLLQRNIRYGYVNCDDDRLIDMSTSDLNIVLGCMYQLYGQELKYIFLDEIQNVEGWHIFVNRLLRMGFHVFVTGSNAKLLSSELATHLTGRYNEIRLYPFSFLEYCKYKDIDVRDLTTKAESMRKAALTEYLFEGGFPELFNIKNKRAYVQGILEAVITKDIKHRYRLRNIDSLRIIAHHLINNTCQEINYNELAEIVGLGSPTTIKKYVGYLSQAFLIQQVQKLSFKSRERLRASNSYVVDTGLIANRENTLILENYGWRLENVVFIELLRRCAPQFMDIYYYKPSSRSKEVDFAVCKQGKVKQLLQVAYYIDEPKTFKREVDALIQAS